jgi:hypothetical protein
MDFTVFAVLTCFLWWVVLCVVVPVEERTLLSVPVVEPSAVELVLLPVVTVVLPGRGVSMVPLVAGELLAAPLVLCASAKELALTLSASARAIFLTDIVIS